MYFTWNSENTQFYHILKHETVAKGLTTCHAFCGKRGLKVNSTIIEEEQTCPGTLCKRCILRQQQNPNPSPLVDIVAEEVFSRIKDGKCIVRVLTHRARGLLKKSLGYLPQGYYKWGRSGEWREIPQDKLSQVKQIQGIRTSTWDSELRMYTHWTGEDEIQQES